MSRGVFKHRVLRTKPGEVYPEGYAWIWMLAEAAWREHAVRSGTAAAIELKRGEFAHSIRFMAEAWGWKPSRVQRFLDRLKSERMIDTRVDTGRLVVTICNYNKYQIVAMPVETITDKSAIRDGYKEEYQKENIEEKKEADGSNAERVKDYAFEGRTIRLTRADYNKWREECWAIPDFDAELRLADTYYARKSPKDGDTFFPIYRWLTGEQRKAASRRANGDMPPDLLALQ